MDGGRSGDGSGRCPDRRQPERYGLEGFALGIPTKRQAPAPCQVTAHQEPEAEARAAPGCGPDDSAKHRADCLGGGAVAGAVRSSVIAEVELLHREHSGEVLPKARRRLSGGPEKSRGKTDVPALGAPVPLGRPLLAIACPGSSRFSVDRGLKERALEDLESPSRPRLAQRGCAVGRERHEGLPLIGRVSWRIQRESALVLVATNYGKRPIWPRLPQPPVVDAHAARAIPSSAEGADLRDRWLERAVGSEGIRRDDKEIACIFSKVVGRSF